MHGFGTGAVECARERGSRDRRAELVGHLDLLLLRLDLALRLLGDRRLGGDDGRRRRRRGGTRVAQGQRAACARGLAVADVGGVSVAERSVAVVTAAPTDHAAVVEAGAGVEGAGADRDGGATGAEADGRAGHLARSVPDRVLRAVAGPALEAEAPAADPTRVEDDAGMAHAGGDRGRGAAETEVDDSDRGGRLAVADVHGVAVAEAPLESGSPALDLARVRMTHVCEYSDGLGDPPAAIATAVPPPRLTGPAAAGVSPESSP